MAAPYRKPIPNAQAIQSHRDKIRQNSRCILRGNTPRGSGHMAELMTCPRLLLSGPPSNLLPPNLPLRLTRAATKRRFRVEPGRRIRYDSPMEQHIDTTGYHYNIMRRAIDLLDAAQTPMSLEELSDQMQMSPAHFQRLFSSWVGVSPKRYQQYLALGHAKTLLAERFTVLETSLATGLSGTSRLHDLFLRWEAMSPGAYARKGADLTIRFGWMGSPFGEALVMGTDKGICGIAFSAEMGREAAWQDMTARWPDARYVADDAALRPWAEAAFALSGTSALHMIGAPFQIKVWEALLHIPSGHVTTYSQIAGAIGRPKAVRAVGTAVGRNPVSWLIPCHRALRKSGGLGGYHWGLPVKRALLAYESARAEA